MNRTTLNILAIIFSITTMYLFNYTIYFIAYISSFVFANLCFSVCKKNNRNTTIGYIVGYFLAIFGLLYYHATNPKKSEEQKG